MSSAELRQAIQTILRRHSMTTDNVTPGSCTALVEHVQNICKDEKKRLLVHQKFPRTSTTMSRLIQQNRNILDFHHAPNHKLRAFVSRDLKITQIAKHIGIDMNLAIKYWIAEKDTMIFLAPARKDLLMRF